MSFCEKDGMSWLFEICVKHVKHDRVVVPISMLHAMLRAATEQVKGSKLINDVLEDIL